MPRKAKSPARAETTGDWDHREAAPASQLDAFGFRKKSAYTPDDAHKVDAQMAKWVAEGKYSGTQGRTGRARRSTPAATRARRCGTARRCTAS